MSASDPRWKCPAFVRCTSTASPQTFAAIAIAISAHAGPGRHPVMPTNRDDERQTDQRSEQEHLRRCGWNVRRAGAARGIQQHGGDRRGGQARQQTVEGEHRIELAHSLPREQPKRDVGKAEGDEQQHLCGLRVPRVRIGLQQRGTRSPAQPQTRTPAAATLQAPRASPRCARQRAGGGCEQKQPAIQPIVDQPRTAAARGKARMDRETGNRRAPRTRGARRPPAPSPWHDHSERPNSPAARAVCTTQTPSSPGFVSRRHRTETQSDNRREPSSYPPGDSHNNERSQTSVQSRAGRRAVQQP